MTRHGTARVVATGALLVALGALTIPAALAQEYPLHTGDARLNSNEATPGGSVHVEGDGFEPGAAVSATLESDPVDLGTVAADGNGAVAADFTIPSAVPAGNHELKLTGAASGTDGLLVLSAPLTVTDPAGGPVDTPAKKSFMVLITALIAAVALAGVFVYQRVR